MSAVVMMMVMAVMVAGAGVPWSARSWMHAGSAMSAPAAYATAGTRSVTHHAAPTARAATTHHSTAAAGTAATHHSATAARTAAAHHPTAAPAYAAAEAATATVSWSGLMDDASCRCHLRFRER